MTGAVTSGVPGAMDLHMNDDKREVRRGHAPR